MNYPETVKATFKRVLSEMASNPTSFVNNPEKDFSRNRKLSFEDTLKLIISMEGNSLTLEMLDFFQFSNKSPSVSAFLQQRNKLNSSALETVFQKFNTAIPCKGTFKGYRLLTCDGSYLNFERNPEDEDNYYDPGHSAKGFNIMHLNALYDLCDRRYVDALIQSGHGKDEFRALCSMVDRYTAPVDHKSIFIADRGYSSYNVFAHIIEKNEYFLITSDAGILKHPFVS